MTMVNGVEPIGDAAQYRIDFIGIKIFNVHPCAPKRGVHLWGVGKMFVPQAGVVGATVSQYG